jgi:hypothetical protein
MRATPVIPGRLYNVSYRGTVYSVLARHPVDAILSVLEAHHD